MSRTMRLISLVATPAEDNPERDQVTLVLDDGNDEHSLNFEGYPTLSLHFGSGDSLQVSFSVSRVAPAHLTAVYENGLRLPSPE